ncbi:hypothetical protein GYMLUDRAFT_250154 [Collybiopsis luxurians FD-317 M1]|uniref:Uncharacterized protein n=1 Tax=Collybiopsis luxurians FD-317 M1 TaxID=944289 RepID=A0A0D0ATB1_9AGAR|nr:hypothetical protein GYMLUDRAFT_250154 [Collybiopsis luxurians FD-317 M1]
MPLSDISTVIPTNPVPLSSNQLPSHPDIQIRTTIYTTSTSCKTLLRYRQHPLQLARMLQESYQSSASAIYTNLSKSTFEVYIGEINPVIDRATISAKRVELPPILSASNYIHPSNSRRAIAAGWTVCLKLSEVTSNYAGYLQQFLPQYLDQDVIRVVFGCIPGITKVLELKWDHVFYAGNGTLASIMAAAAANTSHLSHWSWAGQVFRDCGPEMRSGARGGGGDMREGHELWTVEPVAALTKKGDVLLEPENGLTNIDESGVGRGRAAIRLVRASVFFIEGSAIALHAIMICYAIFPSSSDSPCAFTHPTFETT